MVKAFGSEEEDLVKAIEVSRQNPNLIFVTQKVGSSGKLWKSEDGGRTWSDINLPFTSNQTMYLSINIEHELFLALRNRWDNNKVYKSTDLGNSWTNLSTNILDDELIENIQVQEGTNGGVYLTSKNKVWYRNNSHSDWKCLQKDYLKISKLPKYFIYRDGKIRIAGTRGIWEGIFEISKQKPNLLFLGES